MKQQINLYQEQFHIRSVGCSARQIAVVSLCSLGLMGLISLSLAWMNHNADSSYGDLALQVGELKQNNDKLRRKLDAQVVDPALRAAVEDAQKQLGVRQKITQWVDTSQLEEVVKFSALLEGLGRRNVNGMWLSHIGINSGGSGLHLEGITLNPKLIPEFLSRLNAEPAYVGREFRKVVMKQDEQNPRLVHFVLSSEDVKESRAPLLSNNFMNGNL